mgnify:CR=1 FL=1
MEKESFQEIIKEVADKFLDAVKEKDIFLVSHFDTDGITSAAIMVHALKKLDKRFTLKIVKSLEEEFIYKIPKNKLVLFLDLASGSLEHIKKAGLKDVFIIDHHEVIQEIPKEVTLLNSWLNDKKKICSSGLAHMFCREINCSNSVTAKLAVLGMIGDLMESHIENLGKDILKEGDVKKIKGLMIYPSTRPLNKVLEYNSNPYIPGVTGNPQGVIELLRSTGIEQTNGKYKSLIELDEAEMEKLTTSIILRNPQTKNRAIIGEIFLIKFFNKMEDAREISAMVNACSRLGNSDAALKFCMEMPNAKREAEEIHARYKQHIISGLDFVSKSEKIKGKSFVIINAKNQIKDTIIGTIASILSNSPLYEEGTIISALAYYEDKIKVSMRICGREENKRNLREILEKVIKEVGGETGGHEFAAGCIVSQNNEEKFIETLKRTLEVEMVKI